MQISGDSSLQTSGPSIEYTKFMQIKTSSSDFPLLSPYSHWQSRVARDSTLQSAEGTLPFSAWPCSKMHISTKGACTRWV